MNLFGDCAGLALAELVDSYVFGAVAIEVDVARMNRFFNSFHISNSSHLEALEHVN